MSICCVQTDSRAAGILGFCYAEFCLYVIRATLLDCSLISNKLRPTLCEGAITLRSYGNTVIVVRLFHENEVHG